MLALRNAMLAIACGLTLAGSAVAAATSSAATTVSSSLTKTGTDAATASSVSSTTPAAVGSTQIGDTINWVLHYRNVSGASASTTLKDPFGGGQTFVPGSLQVPQGLAPQWSTNGGSSFLPSEPAAGVDAIGATGTSVPGSTGAQAPFPPAAGGFTGAAGGGDGWEAILFGNNVYNVHHHLYLGATGRMLDCHDKGTGTRCPAYAGGGLNVPQTAGAPFDTAPVPYDVPSTNFYAMDRANGRVYTPVGIDATNRIGLICADLTNDTSCGFIQLGTSTANNTNAGAGSGGAQIGGATQIASKIYVIGDHGQLYCYDYATNATCAAVYPINTVGAITINPGGPSQLGAGGNARVFDGRYVFTNVFDMTPAQHVLSCVDATTNAVCPGFPKVVPGADYQWTYGIVPILSAAGALTGVCTSAVPTATIGGATNVFACFDLAGNAVANPYPQQAPGQLGLVDLGQGVAIGTKVYLPYQDRSVASLPTTYTCFDFAVGAAGAPCVGFNQALNTTTAPQDIQAYTLHQDEDNPSCIWEVGNAGIFQVFDANTGKLGCPSTSVTVAPSTAYCDGKPGHVSGWDQVTIDGVVFSDYTQATVTISDADGNPVPGFNGLVLPNTQQTLDISSIPITGNTAKLSVHVNLQGLLPGVQPTLSMTFKGDPVQVCFQTKVVNPGCTTHATDISNGANVVTAGSNGVTDAPGGASSGSATFRLPANIAGCSADLEVVKTGLPSPVIPGRDATYTLHLTNHGPDEAVNVSLVDPLPAGETFVSASPGCTQVAGTVTCTLASLASGASADFTVVAHVASSVTGPVDNVATVSSPTPDPDLTNNSSPASLPTLRSADLAIAKSATTDAAVPGEDITYTLVVTNKGPSDTSNVTVVDPLPAGLTFVSADPRCAAATGKVTCTLVALASGQSVSFNVVAHVDSTQSAALTNTATVSGPDPDPDPTNNSATLTLPLAPQSDLAIVKSGPGSGTALEPLTYTLTVTNNGPSTSPSAIVNDAHGGCSNNGQNVGCKLGPMPKGASVTITVAAIPQKSVVGLNVPNTATVSGPNNDPDTRNNTSTAQVLIKPALPDLRVSKKLVAGTPRVGETLTYAIVVDNIGHGPATDAIVTDTLPSGLQFVSAKPAAGTCSGTQVQTCAVGTLLAGGSVSIELRAKVVHSGAITNTAAARSNEADKNPQDNLASVLTASSAPVDPVLRKRADRPVAARGGLLPYTITFRNPGAGTLHDVLVCDTLPTGETYRSATPKARLTRGKVCWTIAAIAAGSSRTFHLVARVDVAARGSRLTNRVTATGTGMQTKTATAAVPLRGVSPQRAAGVTG
jgi:uncharacterized repeat protein (TIGR01451 family)